MAVYSKILEIRKKVRDLSLKKTGKNKFADFDYYELGDFLPQVIDLEKELKLLSLFDVVDKDINKARLLVIDTEDGTQHYLETSIAEANVKGMLDIQQLGSVHTYLKRYLYLNYLNLTEYDTVDRVNQKDKTETTPQKATKNQVDIIIKLLGDDVSRGAKITEYYGVKNFADLTPTQASETIAKLKK